MPLTFNGNTPENVNWNGVALSKVTYNGGAVWEKVASKEYVNKESVYFNSNDGDRTFSGRNSITGPVLYSQSPFTYYGMLHEFDIDEAPQSKIKIKYNILIPDFVSSSITKTIRVFIIKDGVLTDYGTGKSAILYTTGSVFSNSANELVGVSHDVGLAEAGKIYEFEDEFNVGTSITSNKVYVGIRGEETIDNQRWETYGKNTGDHITKIYVS